jgi:hypothetical protein
MHNVVDSLRQECVRVRLVKKVPVRNLHWCSQRQLCNWIVTRAKLHVNRVSPANTSRRETKGLAFVVYRYWYFILAAVRTWNLDGISSFHILKFQSMYVSIIFHSSIRYFEWKIKMSGSFSVTMSFWKLYVLHDLGSLSLTLRLCASRSERQAELRYVLRRGCSSPRGNWRRKRAACSMQLQSVR